ncbi:MAG: LLM class flavin-dependent oxidoreductase [Thermoproteota archaeon]|nr:LLM class flavin-dependent oxidoreductase [Thermoproteota archaeon]HYZ94589.1 LLM class flavin-dependent oxidoreductase [Nitrososphaeraceae archaeon]HZB00044.1 LLM class flavin-dependent oxidoreductase [Nitrososphaera sp.]
MNVKFGFTQGLNVARLGLDESQVITACQIADRMDYDSVWSMDHSNVPQWKNAVVNDAWLMLAAIGAVTSHVELGTCVTDAIRRHPSAIALSTITLDRITKGRAILGIGAGEAQNVVDFGIEFSKPVSKFKEQLEVIEKLFESEPDRRVSYKGQHYNLVEACLQARSIRKPRPPVYIAAGAPKTLELCAKYGDGWIPIGYTPELFKNHANVIRDRAKEIGRDLNGFQFANDVDIYFTDDGEEAWNKMKNAVKVSLYKPELLKVHNIQQDSEFDFRRYFTEYAMNKPELMEQMKRAALKIPDSVARTAIGVGKPEDVIQMLERFIDAGTNHFIIRFWGDGYFKNIETFGNKVITYFRDQGRA